MGLLNSSSPGRGRQNWAGRMAFGLEPNPKSKRAVNRMPQQPRTLSLLFALLLLAVPAARAQQYYLNLTASYKSTNTAGVLVPTKMTNPTLLNEILLAPSVARGHSLVFDVESGEVQVIHKASGEVLGAWYVFAADTTVSSADGSKSEVYWTISCPVDTGYEGTAVGTVQLTRGLENEITRFKMTGKFTLRHQPEGGGAARVYTGVFSTGARYIVPNVQ